MSSSSFSYYNSFLFLLLLLLLLTLSRSCCGFGTFGFDIHHRYSDPVKGILSVDDLPDKGTPHYYASMAHRDRLIHGRRLATANNLTPLTFLDGNETYRISSLGFLHYADVIVGTPGLSFLVALDTGSDLFWLPCDCTSCVRGLKTSSGKQIKLNIYSSNTSSTSQKVTCDSSLCSQRCSSSQTACPYQVLYLSANTSSTGFLVEDLLHLTTDNTQPKAHNATITFGCGQRQTGSFLEGAAPNGLFGLGMKNVSVPSTLAREGLTSNSFSMCFGPDGVGRITFGDTGTSDQGETPFNLRESHPTYNISISKITVGGNDTNLEFSAIFDTGTSFTYLNDPAYSFISESFNNQAKDKRYLSAPELPFEYCYELSSNQMETEAPILNLVMKGGSQYNVTDPIVIVAFEGNVSLYCLAVVRSGDVNIIGQNFMTGYHIVFDREKNILGWKPSNCYDLVDANTLSVHPTSPGVSPTTTVKPEATAGNDNNPNVFGEPPPSGNHSPKLNPLSFAFTTVLISLFYNLIIS